jgi:hypothetical protein
MEWIVVLVTGLALAVLLLPLVALLVTFFVLIPLAHLQPPPRTLARTTFACPFSNQTASAAFLTTPGADRATDVVSCSVFGKGAIRCKKGCLGLAGVQWTPSPMVPRYALVADGFVPRNGAAVGAAPGKP